MALKPTRDKFSELFSSMLLSAMFAALAALVAPVLLGIATNSASMAVYLWLALVGTLFKLDESDTWYVVSVVFVISVALHFAALAV